MNDIIMNILFLSLCVSVIVIMNKSTTALNAAASMTSWHITENMN